MPVQRITQGAYRYRGYLLIAAGHPEHKIPRPWRILKLEDKAPGHDAESKNDALDLIDKLKKNAI